MTNTCRSCDAEVIFVPSAKTGRPMILDAKPAKGVVLWDRVAMDTVSAKRLSEGESQGLGGRPLIEQVEAHVEDVFTDHHVTCPDAASWKGRKR